MTRPTDDQVNILARHLGDLPQLAAESVTGDLAGTLVSVRGAARSRLPPGVDLAALDLADGRQQPALLHRLHQCVRTVHYGMTTDGQGAPPLADPGDVCWWSESRWLLDTLDWWRLDDWCAEWIHDEVEHPETGIMAKLTAAKLRREDPTRRACPTCGVRLSAYTTASLMVAECPACDRVEGVEPRRMMTVRQAAARWQVTPRAVQKAIRAKSIALLGTVEGRPAYDSLALAGHFEEAMA